jgi:hypothetical protein
MEPGIWRRVSLYARSYLPISLFVLYSPYSSSFIAFIRPHACRVHNIVHVPTDLSMRKVVADLVDLTHYLDLDHVSFRYLECGTITYYSPLTWTRYCGNHPKIALRYIDISLQYDYRSHLGCSRLSGVALIKRRPKTPREIGCPNFIGLT